MPLTYFTSRVDPSRKKFFRWSSSPRHAARASQTCFELGSRSYRLHGRLVPSQPVFGGCPSAPPTTVALRRSAPLLSDIESVNGVLGRGIPGDGLVEWGVPAELAGRYVILSFIAALHRQSSQGLRDRVLWINRPFDLTVSDARAWTGRGVDLARIHFSQVAHPFSDLSDAFRSADLDRKSTRLNSSH